MDKYIQVERPFFRFYEDLFQPSDLTELSFVAFTSSNIENYLKSNSSNDTINLLDESNPKLAKAYILSKGKEDTFLKNLTKLLPDIFSILQDKKISIEDIITGEYHKYIKILAKKISFQMHSYIELLKSRNITKIIVDLPSILAEKNDFITFITFLYILHHHRILKITSKKHEKIQHILELYIDRCLDHYNYITQLTENENNLKSIQQLLNKSERKDKIIATKKNELLKTKKSLEEYKKKIIFLENESVKNNKNQLFQEINELEQKNNLLESELDKIKSESIKKAKYQKLQNSFHELNKKYLECDLQLNELYKKINELESVSLEEKLENFLIINGLTDSMIQLIHPFFEDFMNDRKPIKSTGNLDKEIGFCKIQNQEHYFFNIKGEVKKIYNIPNDILIGQNQFLLVDNDGNFFEGYNCCYTESSYYKNIHQFGILKKIEDQWFAQINEKETVEILNPRNYTLLSGKVIGINESKEVLHIYKTLLFNADYYLKSALIRNQEVYLVHDIIQNGIIGTELHTSKKKFVTLETDSELVQYSIIFIKQGKLVNVILNPRFYTSSKYYEGHEYGIVKFINNKTYFIKKNGEILLLKLVPPLVEIDVQDVIVVDEYGNFIRKEEDFQNNELSIDQKVISYHKNKRSTQDNQNKKKAEKQHKEVVLIIGDIGLSNSYKLNLLKVGYKSEVISGFESWNKISKEIRAADIIVFVTEHASHENYYKLKAEVKDRNIIYSPAEGINRIIALINSSLQATQEISVGLDRE